MEFPIIKYKPAGAIVHYSLRVPYIIYNTHHVYVKLVDHACKNIIHTCVSIVLYMPGAMVHYSLRVPYIVPYALKFSRD